MGDYKEGVLTVVPVECPFAESGVGCCVRRHDRRYRKTGPVHPLAVLRCHVHLRSFTVYPQGFTPYARRQLLSGESAFDEPSYVAVVTEAATQPLWGSSIGPPPRYWRTQARLVARVEALFGVVTNTLNEEVALSHGLFLSTLQQLRMAHGLKTRAGFIVRLVTGRTLHELLLLGYKAGLWGEPLWWDPLLQTLVSMTLTGEPRGPPR